MGYKQQPLYGLPTFPIYDEMPIGMRPWLEVEWLLNHGMICSALYNYYGIQKTPEGVYQLFWCEDGIADPSMKIEAESKNLKTLVLSQHIGIGEWIWLARRETVHARARKKG